jgi:hypothetical protein
MTVNYWGVIWEIVKHPPGFLFRDEHLKQTEKGIFRLNGGQQGCKKNDRGGFDDAKTNRDYCLASRHFTALTN